MRVRTALLLAAASSAALARATSFENVGEPLVKVTAASARGGGGATVQVVHAWLTAHELPAQDPAKGYPFAPPPSLGPWARAPPSSESAAWIALVRASDSDSDRNSNAMAGAGHRRLADSNSSAEAAANALIQPPSDAKEVVGKLNTVAVVQTVQALADFAGVAATGFAAPAIVVFSIALGFLISWLQKKAVIGFINAVATAYQRIAAAAAKVESQVPSLVDVPLIQQRFARISGIAANLDAAVVANKESGLSAITASWTNVCKARDYNTDYQFLTTSVHEIAGKFDAVVGYKVKMFVQLATSYGVAYLKGYQAYTRCMVTMMSDRATLQRILSEDVAERTKMRQNLYAMAAAADAVAKKFNATTLASVVEGAISAGQLPAQRLADNFDSVAFTVRDHNGKCASGGDNLVFDINCGVWAVHSGHTCYVVAWSQSSKNIKTERGNQGEYNTYKNSPQRCGFYAEDVNCGFDDKSCYRRTLDAWSVYAYGDKYVAYTERTEPITSAGNLASVTEIVGSAGGGSAATGLQELLTSAQNDSLTLRDAMASGEVQGIMAAIKSEDPALYASLSLPMDTVLDNHEQYMAAIDSSVSDVNAYHGVLMDSLHTLGDDIDTTGGEQLRAMQLLQSQTTAQHNTQMTGIRNLDSSLTKLSSSLDAGFSATRSDIGAIQQDTAAKLQGLLGTVSSVGAKTRSDVKSVLDQASQLTTQRLSTLSSLIAETNGAQLRGIGQLGDTIQETQRQTRDAIASEFTARQSQLRERVIATTYQIASSSRMTVDALLDVTDAMRTELGRQIQLVSEQLSVIDGRVTKISDGLAHLDKQLNEIVQLIYRLNVQLAGIYRTINDLPNALRHELRVARAEGYLRRAAHLSGAYTNYLKHNMGQLQGAEFVRACDVNGYYVLYQNLLAEVKPVALEPELRAFAYSRADYERFGATVLGAAYHQRFMLVPCANMKSLRDLGTVAMDDDAARQFDVDLLDAMWIFRANVEENIPHFFLGAYAATARLGDYLLEARQRWADTNDFDRRALEPVRARVQDDLGDYAYASFLNVPDAAQLQLWTADSAANGTTYGANRYGASRVRDDLVVLWSNTRKELPPALRERLQATELPADAPLTEASLSVAFTGTPWQPYWDAGLVRAVARVAAVDDACPWAVSGSHYPFCWQRARACHCVQLEGVPAAPNAEHMANASLVPTDVALFTAFELVSDPRSEFITTARRQSRASASDAALAPNEMRGIPENRVRFSLCMSSEPPVHAARLATGEAHQPPPQLTRCVASDARVYDVVPDAALNGSSTFLPAGSAVSEAMFRALAIGDTVPEVTFFDAQRGTGNYIVCANCVMDELRTVYMFRVLSFKLGRPAREKRVVCERHPRLPYVEYCPGTGTGLATSRFWTPPVLLATELPRLVASVGASLPRGQSDRVAMAEALSAGLHTLLGAATDDFAFFKVYVARAGAFANATDTYWTSMPTHADREERGWSVVPGFYATETAEEDDGDDEAPPPPTTQAYDALVMWSTLAADARRVAHHVVRSKPAGASLQSHLAATFAAYKVERILRGFFAERMRADATECPVAGDADHFAYCTPTPVDAQCMCVQLEDLPDEYRELYDGRAPHGRVVAFGDDTAVTSYVVGRSRGDTTPNALPVLVDGRMWRNVSDAALCLQTDFSHPERGATCVVAPGGSAALEPRGLRVQLARDAAPPSVVVGERVAEVFVATETWSARCRGCMDAVVSELVQFQEDAQDVDVRFAGLVVGRACATASADGGGELTVCVA